MTRRPLRTVILPLLAIAVLGGLGALFFLERRCAQEGGQFWWSRVACEAGARPVILQGDIHRV
ncbi:MAG: hypothetical protein Q7T86_03720 [Hyphomicrobiaceae bacterium]|nr:hypothetical protein [Hyphomicrobiaceae bacterium]